ncbi:MAG: glycosyltransferase [Chloroflexi bacterium]|nr:glycosyltransferase [Chloroflexota bacterium]
MKRVLIITYLPWATPRVPGLAKYLPEFGWEPVVLTPPLAATPDAWLKVVQTPYRDALPLRLVRKFFRLDHGADDLRRGVRERLGTKNAASLLERALTLGGEIINYPDAKGGWIPFGIETGEKMLGGGDIGAILSSSSPVTGHIIARRLKLRHSLPWVADLRDLWSQNHNYGYSGMRRLKDKRLERRTLAAADALVTVSPPWAERLGQLHGGRAVHTITNGFDPEAGGVAVSISDRFTMTYTGTVYRQRQHPGKLFAALKGLISEGTMARLDIEVRFYGPAEAWIEEETRKYGLQGVVRQHGPLPREAALGKQRQSQILLLFDWDDPQEKGVYPGKVFEYLGARRPILAIGGVTDNVVAGLLRQTGAGVHAPAVEDVKRALGELYREYKLKGEVAYHGEESEINKYSHREMARKFAGILDGLVGGETECGMRQASSRH